MIQKFIGFNGFLLAALVLFSLVAWAAIKEFLFGYNSDGERTLHVFLMALTIVTLPFIFSGVLYVGFYIREFFIN